MNIPKAIITVGFSGCGKSTFAKQHMIENPSEEWVNLERDQIRFELFCEGKRDWTKYKFTRANEERVSNIHTQLLDEYIANKKNIILSDTWLNDKYRNAVIEKLTNAEYQVEIKSDWLIDDDLPTWEKVRKRNEQREGGIGTDILWNQYKRWWTYRGCYKYKPDLNLPECIVFDIDGTLAIKSEERGYFDWDKVHLDQPRWEIVSMLRGMERDYHIVIATGRDACCHELTQKWLDDLGIQYDKLYMRGHGSQEKDYLVKIEMLQEIEKQYRVVAWVDDRPQVSNALRLADVNVIQVSDPLVEF